MVTDISVRSSATWGAEDRSWTIGEHGFDMSENATLDLSLFTHANFTDGLIKSGTVLGLVTATGKYGPYSDAASDGRQTAVGMLFNSVSTTGRDVSKPVADALLTHFLCRAARLPYESGDGALDANARNDLRLVRFI